MAVQSAKQLQYSLDLAAESAPDFQEMRVA
jgi:hypothetical protein